MADVLEAKITKVKLRSENPDPVDIHVGSRVRMRRNLMGFSQEYLGKSLGLTFQQVQKYERGINRIGSSRLFQVARILAVPVAYFFEEIPVSSEQGSQPGFADNKQSSIQGGSATDGVDYDVMRRRETLELVRAYYLIKNDARRRKVYELVNSMSPEK